MNVRKVEVNEMNSIHFAKKDVLGNEDDRLERMRKLIKAVILSHIEHSDVGIVFKLDNDEVVETYCDLIDFAGDYVMIKGGTVIPLISIVDVEF